MSNLAQRQVRVTRGRRLARSLRQRAAESALADQLKVIADPGLLSLGSLTAELWVDHGLATTDRFLLSETQALVLWRDVLMSASTTEFDVSLAGASQSLYDAFKLMEQWNISLTELDNAPANADQQVFRDQVRRYCETLSARGLLDPAQLIGYLTNLPLRRDALPTQITLEGFIEINAAEARLFDSLRAHGVEVVHAQLPDASAKLSSSEFSSSIDEALAAGRWAREQLDIDAQARVTIVSLYSGPVMRRLAERIADGLTPAWQSDPEGSLLTTTVGPALLDYPLVSSLMTHLGALTQPLPFAGLSALLLDPLVTGAQASAMAEFERELRGLPERRYRVAEVRELAAENAPESVSSVVNRLAELEADLASFRERNSVSYWAEQLDLACQKLCPDHGRALDSGDFQLVQALREGLNELARLERVVGQISGVEALGLFRQILAQTIFQPETVVEGVTFMGPYEALGQQFDALWLMGMDNVNWPANARPNPFIAPSVQQAHRVPGIDPTRDLAFAENLLDRVIGSAAQVRMSFASEHDGITRAPATVVLAAEPVSVTAKQASYAATQAGLCPVTVGSVEQVVPLPEGSAMHGGYRLIAQQNDTPFQAFCHFRLGAEPLDSPTFGLGYRARGIALHAAAERLYGDVKEANDIRVELAALQLSDLEPIVRRTFARFRRHADGVLHRLVDAEQQRAVVVLKNLVQMDSERPVFSVHGLEQALELNLGGLRLTLRVDRLDDVAGKLLVIDYKTARQLQPMRRQSGLPGELQLAIYALALRQNFPERPVAAVAALKLHTLGVAYSGIDFDEAMPGVKGFAKVADQDSELQRWSDELSAVAELFRLGDLRLPRRTASDDHLPYGALFASARGDLGFD